RAAFRAPYATAQDRWAIGSFVADIPVDDNHASDLEPQRIGEDIAAFDKPALLVWGPKDPVYVERYLRDLRQRLPQADVYRFETATHLVSEDHDVAGLVLDWLGARFDTPAHADDQGPTDEHSRAEAIPSAVPAGARADASTSATSGSAPVRPITAILDARSQDESIASVDFAQNPAQQITWRHLFEVTTSIANGLLDLGVRPGDRVSMLV